VNQDVGRMDGGMDGRLDGCEQKFILSSALQPYGAKNTNKHLSSHHKIHVHNVAQSRVLRSAVQLANFQGSTFTRHSLSALPHPT